MTRAQVCFLLLQVLLFVFFQSLTGGTPVVRFEVSRVRWSRKMRHRWLTARIERSRAKLPKM